MVLGEKRRASGRPRASSAGSTTREAADKASARPTDRWTDDGRHRDQAVGCSDARPSSTNTERASETTRVRGWRPTNERATE